jgi:hypothetical protein
MADDQTQPVDPHAVMELRRRTGSGVMQCKLILAEAGDVETAVRWLWECWPLPQFNSFSERCPSCGGGLRFAHQMEWPPLHLAARPADQP